MKKIGFTLTEILVAISIIGVVVAITAPAISNLVPDKNKIAVLKAYKTITDIHNQIKADPSLWEVSTDPLNLSGWNLHPQLAQDEVYENYVINNLNIISGSVEKIENGSKCDTIDGNKWIIERPDSSRGSITIVLNGKNDCAYSSTCTNPGKFIFKIDPATLNVKGGDPLTTAYLANSHKLNDMSNDRKTAADDKTKY